MSMTASRRFWMALLYEDVIIRHKLDSRYLHNDRHNLEKISKVIHKIYHFLQGFEYHV